MVGAMAHAMRYLKKDQESDDADMAKAYRKSLSAQWDSLPLPQEGGLGLNQLGSYSFLGAKALTRIAQPAQSETFHQLPEDKKQSKANQMGKNCQQCWLHAHAQAYLRTELLGIDLEEQARKVGIVQLLGQQDSFTQLDLDAVISIVSVRDNLRNPFSNLDPPAKVPKPSSQSPKP